MGAVNKIRLKQIAYLVAGFALRSASLKQVQNESSLITLTPNIFLKDFQNLSGDCQIASISLNCLAQICDSELALTLY